MFRMSWKAIAILLFCILSPVGTHQSKAQDAALAFKSLEEFKSTFVYLAERWGSRLSAERTLDDMQLRGVFSGLDLTRLLGAYMDFSHKLDAFPLVVVLPVKNEESLLN